MSNENDFVKFKKKGGDMLGIVISGSRGRMGKRIFEASKNFEEVAVKGLLERKGHPEIGIEIEGMKVTDNPEIIKEGDVLIEFTNPEATVEHIEYVLKYKKKVVIGTTALNQEQVKKIEEASKEIPIVFSPNMSVGVNFLFEIVKIASNVLKDYDKEIIEIHHNKKKDAPSGTAMKIAEIIKNECGGNLVFGRKGLVGERKKEEIGVLAVRSGDVVGEHIVLFAGNNERIEIIHRAHSRDAFASGAIRSAIWLKDKKSGLYSMKDVLGL